MLKIRRQTGRTKFQYLGGNADKRKAEQPLKEIRKWMVNWQHRRCSEEQCSKQYQELLYMPQEPTAHRNPRVGGKTPPGKGGDSGIS